MPFDLAKYDELLARGLCRGIGSSNGNVCIEAAVALASGEEFSDMPTCVLREARDFAVRLNDGNWSSYQARSEGMRELGLAQLGTAHLDGATFVKRLTEATIREVVPIAFRDAAKAIPSMAAELIAAAERCEQDGTVEAAHNAVQVADKAWYASARADGAAAEPALAAARALVAARPLAGRLADAADCCGERGLILAAQIATRILRDMKAELS